MHLVREQRHRDRDRDELPDDARHAPPDPRARGERQREREVGQPQRLQMPVANSTNFRMKYRFQNVI
jgi:hypothetical protein